MVILKKSKTELCHNIRNNWLSKFARFSNHNCTYKNATKLEIGHDLIKRSVKINLINSINYLPFNLAATIIGEHPTTCD